VIGLRESNGMDTMFWYIKTGYKEQEKQRQQQQE
jgi:hypothetical protein